MDMKTFQNDHLLLAGAVLGSVAAVVSCMALSEESYPDLLADAVHFSVSSGYDPQTRTAFSGEVSGGTLTYERIDWSDGDAFRVCCDEAQTPSGGHFADYLVKAHRADGVRSLASVASEDPLLWGSGTHTFYGLYPAPGSTGADEGLSFSGNSVHGVIPSEQSLTRSGTVWRPDMRYAYMAAATQVVSAQAPSPVTLVFRPMVTAYEISLLNFASDPVEVDLTHLRLHSTADGARLSGGFSAALQADGSFSATASGEGTDVVSVTFPSGTRLSTSKAITVTLFTLPVVQTNLELVLEFSNGLIRRLPLQDEGVPLRVNPGEKIYLDNLAVPDGWIYHIESPTSVASVTYVGGVSTFRLESYRTKRGVRESVPWNASFSLSPDGPFSEELPEGFALDATAGTGASITVTANVGAQAGSSRAIDLTASHRERFATLSADPRGSRDAPFDLSMYNLGEDVTRATGAPVTANCYIVDRAGWYMFPLVYGNAIDYAKVADNRSDKGGNTVSYMPAFKSYIGFLSPFQNAMGEGIVSPYVLDDLSACGFVSPEALADHKLDAVIIWQDVEPGREIVSHPEILWAKPVAANAESGLPCPYIRFQVFEDAANYTQGNALLALRDISGAADQSAVQPSEARILWSWHIWVTDEQIAGGLKKTVNKIGGQGYNWMFPVNLGYCDPDSYLEKTYPGRECWIRLSQTFGGAETLLCLRQDPEVVTETKAGSNPYYQYCRKDPLLPAAGTADGRNKACVSGAGYVITDGECTIPTARPEGDYGYASSILNPHVMLFYPGNYGWTIKSNLNLWDADNTTSSYNMNTTNAAGETPIVKTIYDPCPPGFSVPSKCAFTFMTKNGETTYNKSGFNLAREEWLDGYWFCCENDEGGIFFPANGIRAEDHRGSPVYITTEPHSVKGFSALWVPVHYYTSMGFHGYFSKDRCEQLRGVYDEYKGLSVRPVLEYWMLGASTDGIEAKRYDQEGLDPGEWR